MKFIINKIRKTLIRFGVVGGMLLAAACGTAEDGEQVGADAGTASGVPDEYNFRSRFEPTESSVSYSGQITRHVLIKGLFDQMESIVDDINAETLTATTGSIVARFNFFFEFDGANDGNTPHSISTTPEVLQTTYGELSTKPNLVSKLAGNDTKTDYKCWNPDKRDDCSESEFTGWSLTGTTTPEGLVRTWFQLAEDNAVAVQSINKPRDPDGNVITKYYVTAAGHDLKQLVQKFLLGAIAYSQAMDDYLHDDVLNKGLKANNEMPATDGARYSALEHAWDEGFGYFGGARNYKLYRDEEVARKSGRDEFKLGYHDTNADGKIDLMSEYNFGHSVNAAKRDLGAAEGAKTDMTQNVITAFLTGRNILANAAGELSADELELLKAERDVISANWELAIASTALHYINDTLKDMEKAGTSDYNFYDHAKHWSELKGFALSLQFNPAKKITDSQFVTLHDHIGDAPALPGSAEFEEYKTSLRSARSILVDAYNIDARNTGDLVGEGGW